MHPRTGATTRLGRGWAYTGALLGGLVSVAANVAHSHIPPPGSPADWTPQAGAVVGAVVWPVFLFIAVEILARTAWPYGWSWQLVRWAGLTPVAAVAAFVSYRHMAGLLAHYGEEPVVTVLGPLAVDGLMVMAAGALLATRQHTRPNPTVTSPADPPAPAKTAERATPVPHTIDKARADVPVSPAPAHLVQPARYAVTNHEQTTGRAITADELAARMSIGTDTARRLLTTINHPDPTTPVAPIATNVNGARILDGRPS